jgi:hypothetical protein
MMDKRAAVSGIISFFLILLASPAWASNGSFGDFFGYFLILLVINVILFLICREIVCWYFKINQRLELLTQIRDLLANMPKQTAMAAQASTAKPDNLKTYTLCSKCKKRYDGDLSGQFCEECGSQLREVLSDAVVDYSASSKYCPSCKRADGYHDANGDLYCPNCKKIVSRLS